MRGGRRAHGRDRAGTTRPIWIAVALCALGCYAEPPPPAAPGQLAGCHPGSYGALSALQCARDSDCVLCRTSEEACGELTSRDRIALENPPCPRIDEEACGGARAACCEGRCVRSLGPPSF